MSDLNEKMTFEFATRDDCLKQMVPSDLRGVIAERDEPRARVAELVGTLRFTRDRLLHHGHSTSEIDLVLSKENSDE